MSISKDIVIPKVLWLKDKNGVDFGNIKENISERKVHYWISLDKTTIVRMSIFNMFCHLEKGKFHINTNGHLAYFKNKSITSGVYLKEDSNYDKYIVEKLNILSERRNRVSTYFILECPICHKVHSATLNAILRRDSLRCLSCYKEQGVLATVDEYGSISDHVPGIEKYWGKDNKYLPSEIPFRGLTQARNTYQLICPICGKVHNKRLDAISNNGAYCGGCANSRNRGSRRSLKMVYPKIAEQFDKGNNPISSDEVSPTSEKIYNFYCDGIAGGLKPHIFSKPLYNMVNAFKQSTKTGGCPICSGKQVLSGINDFATMAPELAKEWDYDLNELKPEDVYYRDAKRYHFICNKGGHHFMRDPLHMMRSHEIGTNGCPVCHGKVVEVGSNDLYTTHKEKVDNEWEYDINDILPTEVTAGSQRLIWRHCKNKRCNKIFQTTVFNWATDGVVCCEDCRNRSYSLAEKEVCDYISNLDFDIVEEARIFYDRLSLDILLEKEKIAFEYNGLYWHSTAVRGEDFHKNKYDMACKCGIDLYMIWEDDYLYRKDVVLKRIKDILGVQEIEINLEDCMIDIIREDEAKDFIKNYGLFKGFTAKYYIGVYKNRELIAVSAISDREDNDDAYIEGYCEKYKIESGLSSIINYIEECMHASGIVAKVENATIDWNVIGIDGFVKVSDVEPEFSYLNEHSILRTTEPSDTEYKVYNAGYSVYYKVNNK